MHPCSIIFVHGLTGNRETTWTDKASGVFWPAHLLKNDVPKTRILTFGYDADVVHFWAMASQNRIRNHATNLVNALAQLRERTDTEERPILFVTHSLGGLVFEDVGAQGKTPILHYFSRSKRRVVWAGHDYISKQRRITHPAHLPGNLRCLLPRHSSLRLDARQLGHDPRPDYKCCQADGYEPSEGPSARVRGSGADTDGLP